MHAHTEITHVCTCTDGHAQTHVGTHTHRHPVDTCSLRHQEAHSQGRWEETGAAGSMSVSASLGGAPQGGRAPLPTRHPLPGSPPGETVCIWVLSQLCFWGSPTPDTLTLLTFVFAFFNKMPHPLSPALAATILLPVSMNVTLQAPRGSGITQNIGPSGTGLFHLAWCPRSSPVWQQVSESPSAELSASLHEQTTLWSPFLCRWAPETNASVTWCVTSPPAPAVHPLGFVLGGGIAGSHGNCFLVF